jgi:hypothetical protein
VRTDYATRILITRRYISGALPPKQSAKGTGHKKLITLLRTLGMGVWGNLPNLPTTRNVWPAAAATLSQRLIKKDYQFTDLLSLL